MIVEAKVEEKKPFDPDRELTKEELGKLTMAEQLQYQMRQNLKKQQAKEAGGGDSGGAKKDDDPDRELTKEELGKLSMAE